MREEFDGFFIIKQRKKPFCSVCCKALTKRLENSGETLNYVSCFPYDFFRALAAS